MMPNLLAGALSGVELATRTGRRALAAADALDQQTISDLPASTISEMSCDELVLVIQNARLPFLCDETSKHLAFRDRQTLERLANLAQRCCFNRSTRPECLVGNATYERQTLDA